MTACGKKLPIQNARALFAIGGKADVTRDMAESTRLTRRRHGVARFRNSIMEYFFRKRVDSAPNRMVANVAPRLVDDEPGLERSLREGRR